jgi:excisionase family DNA binding protein
MANEVQSPTTPTTELRPLAGLWYVFGVRGPRLFPAGTPADLIGVSTMFIVTNAADGRTVGPEPRPGASAELLDVKSVALLLGGCSTRHIYRLSDAGRMPRPIRLGSLVRWRRAEVMSWIEGGCPPIRSAKAPAR